MDIRYFLCVKSKTYHYIGSLHFYSGSNPGSPTFIIFSYDKGGGIAELVQATVVKTVKTKTAFETPVGLTFYILKYCVIVLSITFLHEMKVE